MSLAESNSKIKAWNPKNCLFKLRKIYCQKIDYLQSTNWYMLLDAANYISVFACLFFQKQPLEVLYKKRCF